MSPSPPDTSCGTDAANLNAAQNQRSNYSSASLSIQKPVQTLPPPASTSGNSVPYYSLTPSSYYLLGVGNVVHHNPSKQLYNGYSYQDPFSYQMNSVPQQQLPQQNNTQSLKQLQQPQMARPQQNTLTQLLYQPQYQNQLQSQHTPPLTLQLGIPQNTDTQQLGQMQVAQLVNQQGQLQQQIPAQNMTHRMLFPSGQLPVASQAQPLTADDLFVYFKDLAIFRGKNTARGKYNGKMFIHSKHTKSLQDVRDAKLKSGFSPLSLALDPKPYVCTFEGCSWSFARQSDLRRHTKSHKEPGFHCPYWRTDPTCHRNGGSFSRLDVLKRHLRLVHYVKDKQQIFPGSDPGWCRACQKMFQSSKHFIDHCVDCANQISPAEWRSTTAKNEEKTD